MDWRFTLLIWADKVENFFLGIWMKLRIILIHLRIFAWLCRIVDFVLLRKSLAEFKPKKMFGREEEVPISIRAFDEKGREVTFKLESYLRFFGGYARKMCLCDAEPAIVAEHFCMVLGLKKVMLVFVGKLVCGNAVVEMDGGRIVNGERLFVGADVLADNEDEDSEDESDVLALDDASLVWEVETKKDSILKQE
jgi:hypothetical protein